MKRLEKFENVDVVEFLETVMNQNTGWYQTDFEYDKERIEKAAKSQDPKDKRLLWLSRESGTQCVREWDVFIKDTNGYIIWDYYGIESKECLAYAIDVCGYANGKIIGNVYELNYVEHLERVRDKSLKADIRVLHYEKGIREIMPDANYRKVDPELGDYLYTEWKLKDESELKLILREERNLHNKAVTSDLDSHIDKLHNNFIKREVKHIREEIKRKKEYALDGKKVEVRFSPIFEQLGTDGDKQKILSMLAKANKKYVVC